MMISNRSSRPPSQLAVALTGLSISTSQHQRMGRQCNSGARRAESRSGHQWRLAGHNWHRVTFGIRDGGTCIMSDSLEATRAADRVVPCDRDRCADPRTVAGGEAREAGRDHTRTQSPHRRHAGASRIDRRRGRAIYGVPHCDLCRLAPGEARGADPDALRKHQPGARGALSGRRSSSAHVLCGSHHRCELAAPLGRVLRLHA